MAVNGSVVLISLNTGTVESPTFTVIPCQTSGEYSLSVETRDTSCKDSADNSNAPGARSRSLSVETIPGAWPELKVSPSTAEEKLRKYAETGVQIQGRIVVGGTALEEFTGTITSYSLSAPREDNLTASLDIEISGGMTPVED